MRRFFAILCIFGIFIAGMLVGQLYAPFDVWLYALYVLIFSGAIFLVGIYAGQRAERAWTLRREALSKGSLEGTTDSREEVIKIADRR